LLPAKPGSCRTSNEAFLAQLRKEAPIWQGLVKQLRSEDRMTALPQTQSHPLQHVAPDAAQRGTLSGVRVIDLSRLVRGNMLSLQLADFGADVIKIESPREGDTFAPLARRTHRG
jgi:hypothetical protein